MKNVGCSVPGAASGLCIHGLVSFHRESCRNGKPGLPGLWNCAAQRSCLRCWEFIGGSIFGAALSEVIIPPDFYQVGPAESRRWDDIGLRACARDWAAWPGPPSDDLMLRSQFNLFRDIGIHLVRRFIRCAALRDGQNSATRSAAGVSGRSSVDSCASEKRLENVRKHQPLAFLATPFLGNAKKVFLCPPPCATSDQ